MQDMHAYTGRIGSWYIDRNGIYSYNPNNDGPASGVALLKRGLLIDNAPSTLNQVLTPVTKKPVYDGDLRITVGTFTVNAEGSNTDGTVDSTTDDGSTTSSDITFTGSSTGFSVYNNGLMRTFGAIINGAEIVNGQIKKATITDAKINRGTITSATINSASINNARLNSATVGTLTGGSISGATISGGTISGTNINGGTIKGATLTTGNTTITGGGI